MADKIKVKPIDGTDFKEIEITTQNWNLDTRKQINGFFRKGYLEKMDIQCLMDSVMSWKLRQH